MTKKPLTDDEIWGKPDETAPGSDCDIVSLAQLMTMATSPVHKTAACQYRPLTYLALPYSDPDQRVRQYRFEVANRWAAKLMDEMGWVIFSPISHSHPIAEAGGLPRCFAFWEPFDRAYLSVSCMLVVIKLDEWEQSVGVQSEIEMAREMSLPILYLLDRVIQTADLAAAAERAMGAVA